MLKNVMGSDVTMETMFSKQETTSFKFSIYMEV